MIRVMDSTRFNIYISKTKNGKKEAQHRESMAQHVDF
jgi:hypothetical protein